MPVPISQSPSRVLRGLGSRPAQPKRSEPSRRHSGSPSLDHAFPRGSTGVWLRSRSSTGSIPSSYARSSIATSSIATPSASPGPRVNVGVIVLPRISRCTPRKLSTPYNCDETPVAGSAQSSNGEVIESFSWSIAVSRPSRVAPRTIRCSCSSRWPFDVNICGRVSMSFTGRPTSRAASAVSVTLGQTIAFIPNEPPTNGARTRMCESGSPSRWATVS